MKKYNVILGLILSTVLTAGMLPTRLSQGQGNDARNLIGSEIVILAMCLSSWCVSYHIQLQSQLKKWQRIAYSLLICAVLSNLFYHAFNPLFEDYPLTPMRRYPLPIATFRLSLRGFLMGLILVPIAFLFETERQRSEAELDSQKQRAQASEEQKQLLESLVAERTRTLETTLSSLRKSESQLDNQVYVLSRLVASVTHDVVSPLNYVMIIAEQIDGFLQSGQLEKAAGSNQDLLKALVGLLELMNNMLEFTKTQVRQESIVLTEVDLPALINEKLQLFEGIITSKRNRVLLRVDPALTVHTNYNLAAIIVHNLLDNATRYTRGGLISISTQSTGTKSKLVIENMKYGQAENHSKYQHEGEYLQGWTSAINVTQSQGIGLILVRNISALLDIDFSFEVKPDKVAAQLTFNDLMLPTS